MDPFMWVSLFGLLFPQEGPEIRKVLRPTRRSVVAFIRAADPKRNPEVETDRGPGKWLAFDAGRGVGVLEIPPDASDLRVGSGDRRSKPASLGPEASVRWEDRAPEAEVTAEGVVRNLGKDFLIAWVEEQERPVSAILLGPGEAGRLPIGGTIVLVREGGAAWRGSPATEVSRGWGFVPFGDFRLAGFQAEGSYLRWPGFEPDVDFRVSTIYTTVPTAMDVNPAEFDADLAGGSLGCTVEAFEIDLTYLTGSGDGTGRARMPALDVTGALDYDVDLEGARLSIGRPVWGYDGACFDFMLGGSLAALYLHTRYDRFTIRPDDPLLPNEVVAGSATESQWLFGAFVWATVAYRAVEDPLDLSLRVGAGHYFGDGEGPEILVSFGIHYRF